MIRILPSRRARAFLLGALVAGCTPVSNSYIVHSAEIRCDEANRYVYDAVTDMNMKVTSFTQAKPGRPGNLKAVGRDRKGEVDIYCDEAGVRIDPEQTTMGDRTFERGVFLSITGRSGLHIDRGTVTGRDRPVGDLAQVAAEGTPPPSGSMDVEVVPQRGFETVLDFDADLASAGILPIRITIRNGTTRAYSFTLSGITMRRRDGADPPARLTGAQAAALLAAKAASGDAKGDLGNVESARGILVAKELKDAPLGPGASISGYVYYPVADYERAKIQMTDVAAGEPEAFLVEF